MRVLIACEFSGIVRDAFQAAGHEAWSCDLLPSERPGNHIQADVISVLDAGWDMLIAFPPCTYLALTGAQWHSGTGRQAHALAFVCKLMYSPIERIAIENPVGIISTRIRQPDQIIHPWQFGHGYKKRTCLWLRNLPALTPTRIVDGRQPYYHNMPDTADRWKNRSRTLQGIADAMAAQWGRTACE